VVYRWKVCARSYSTRFSDCKRIKGGGYCGTRVLARKRREIDLKGSGNPNEGGPGIKKGVGKQSASF